MAEVIGRISQKEWEEMQKSKDILNYTQCEKSLAEIEQKFLRAKTEFSTFSRERKEILRNAGKIIGYIEYLLSIYRHSENNKEKREKIKKIIKNALECIEKNM